MTAKQIIDSLNDVEIYQHRKVVDNYAEIVIMSKDILVCTEVIQQILGQPQSAAGIEPTDEDIELTKAFGGLAGNQTLFRKDFADNIIISMFWPWQDGEHITVKVVCLEKKEN